MFGQVLAILAICPGGKNMVNNIQTLVLQISANDDVPEILV